MIGRYILHTRLWYTQNYEIIINLQIWLEYFDSVYWIIIVYHFKLNFGVVNQIISISYFQYKCLPLSLKMLLIIVFHLEYENTLRNIFRQVSNRFLYFWLKFLKFLSRTYFSSISLFHISFREFTSCHVQ